ncbi:hypothetical protein [Oceanobacillus jeddahense]|uniref:GNAT family N-acetyltransferase n=1 Tax=Oceanobacillus jeddahense TaxID=1462527 RepID=A0ABY5JSU9_9BACI|nr:hypothetical protein [Oceanobacillus jeddahense]UUI02860.1 hypothetical protein NP439_22980 [Oceanobacillus jeddahense]
MSGIKKVKRFNQIEIHSSLIEKLETVKARLQSDKYHELFIAEKDGKAIALVFSWLNPFHPSAKYIQFFVSKELEKKVCMDKLFDSILKNTSSQDKWIYSCYSNEKVNIDFIEEKEFQLFRKTFEEIFEVEWMLQHLDIKPLGITVDTLKK